MMELIRKFASTLQRALYRVFNIPTKAESEEINARLNATELFVKTVDGPKLPPLGSDFKEVGDPNLPPNFSAEFAVVSSEGSLRTPEDDEDDYLHPREEEDEEDDEDVSPKDDEDDEDLSDMDDDDEGNIDGEEDPRWLENYRRQMELARQRLIEETPPELIVGIISYMNSLIRDSARGDITAVWDFAKDSTVVSCLTSELKRKSLYSLIRNEFDMDYLSDRFEDDTADWKEPKDVALYILSEVDWERTEFETFRADVTQTAELHWMAHAAYDYAIDNIPVGQSFYFKYLMHQQDRARWEQLNLSQRIQVFEEFQQCMKNRLHNANFHIAETAKSYYAVLPN